MFKSLFNSYNSIKLKKHLVDLKRQFVFGVNFCSSNIYPDKQYQFLNIKIKNETNDRNRIKFGDYCNVSCNITLNKLGTILVGDYVFMNYVTMRIDYDLNIGSHCMFGPNVVLWDTDNHPLSASKRHIQCEEIAINFPLSKSYDSNGGSITIENDVWIGMDALILGGVTIGQGAIVSARSVVTKNVDPYTMVGGVPAKFLGFVPH